MTCDGTPYRVSSCSLYIDDSLVLSLCIVSQFAAGNEALMLGYDITSGWGYGMGAVTAVVHTTVTVAVNTAGLCDVCRSFPLGMICWQRSIRVHRLLIAS
jgi:hypothetical protein